MRLRFFEHVTIDDHFGVIIGSIFHQTWMYDTCYDTDALDMLGCWVKGFGCWRRLRFMEQVKALRAGDLA